MLNIFLQREDVVRKASLRSVFLLSPPPVGGVVMKSLLILFMIFTLGCTTVSFNPETNEFSYWSTKEYKSFEAAYKDRDKEFILKAKDIKAFEGQQILFDAATSAIKPY